MAHMGSRPNVGGYTRAKKYRLQRCIGSQAFLIQRVHIDCVVKFRLLVNHEFVS